MAFNLTALQLGFVDLSSMQILPFSSRLYSQDPPWVMQDKTSPVFKNIGGYVYELWLELASLSNFR